MSFERIAGQYDDAQLSKHVDCDDWDHAHETVWGMSVAAFYDRFGSNFAIARAIDGVMEDAVRLYMEQEADGYRQG